MHVLEYRAWREPGYRVAGHGVRDRRDNAAVAGADRPGHGPARPLRRAHAHREQRPRRLQADARRSCSTALGAAGARAVVFPMHEPDGYAAANDAVIAAAAAHPEQLVAFCRVSPHDGALEEARRALDAGARGIKLHPRAEQFGMDEPAVAELVALAHERRVPVLIHAGRGIPALGENTVRLAERHPDATLILAHAAISDLAWLWRVLPSRPERADRHVVVEPGRPRRAVRAGAAGERRSGRATPPTGARCPRRCGRCAARSRPAARRTQLRGIAGGTIARVLDGARPRGPRAAARRPERGARPAARARGHEPVRRLRAARGRRGPGRVARARAARVRGRHRRAARRRPRRGARAARPLRRPSSRRRRPVCASRLATRYMVHALCIARTPDVPLPALPDAPPPTRAEAEA